MTQLLPLIWQMAQRLNPIKHAGMILLTPQANLLDSTGKKYWATDDNAATPQAVIELTKPTTFNVIQLREYLPLGQRVDKFAIDSWTGSDWKEIATATSIGNRRLLQIHDPVTTTRVRMRIAEAAACPALWGFGLYRTPGE